MNTSQPIDRRGTLRRRAFFSIFLAALAASGTAAAAADDGADLRPAIVEKCKKATVLVDLGREGSGSGFLVHKSGIFVTNAHVVRNLPPGALAKVVLNSGQPEQKIVSARTVLIAEEDDLAFLKTDEPVGAEPLPLSDDAGLVELSKAVVFGYPFGTMLASGGAAYPAISVNAGHISSLRRDGAVLDKIQLDAATNPGNSGGPLVDKDGKVIGIIVSGIAGANVNFAIPSAKLLPLLQKPVLSLRAPEIPYSHRTEAREFEVEVFPTAPIPPDAQISVQFGEPGPAAQKPIAAVRREGRYYIQAAPYDASKAVPLRLRVEATFDQLTLVANFDDRQVHLGDRTVWLSQLRGIEKKTEADKKTKSINTTLTHYSLDREEYETVVGNVTGLPTLKSKINQVEATLDGADRITLGVYDSGALNVPYEITLSAKGKAVTSNRGTITYTDPPHGLGDDDEEPKARQGYRRLFFSMAESGLKLNDFIDPEKDAKQGTWVKTEKALETKAEPEAWCELPVLPKDDYFVQLQLTAKQNDHGELLLQLPVQKASVLLHIGGAGSAMKLDLLEGKNRDGGDSVPIAPFVAGKEYEVRVFVQTSGKQARVVAYFDDTRPLVWSGLIRNLAPPKGLPVGADKLSLGQHNLEMSIQSIRVGGGEGGLRILRETPGQIRHQLGPLLGRWSFDDPPKGNKLPSMFRGHAAVMVGSPQIGVGPAVLGTGAMKVGGEGFTGISVEESETSNKGNTARRALSMWFRPDAPVPEDQRQYIYHEGGSFKGFALYLEGSTLFAGGWDTKAKWPGTWIKAPAITAAQWHHAALVLDGKSAEKDQAFRFYLDGVLVGSGFGQGIGSHDKIVIGSGVKATQICPDPPANPAATTHQFAGMIDEVEIFNGLLSAGSVAIFAGGRYGIGTPNDNAVSAPPPPPAPPSPPSPPASAANPPTTSDSTATTGALTAKGELDRVWNEYQAKLTERLQGDQDTYLKSLEKLEADATSSGDAIGAGVIHAERDSKGLGIAAPTIPRNATSPQMSELRKLGDDFKRKRGDAVRALNTWCLAQLEVVEHGFTERNDLPAAATIHVEGEALSKPPLEVIRASYGASKTVDVTLVLRKAIRFNRIEVAVGNHLAGDPQPTMRKNCSVNYRLEGGAQKTVQFSESGTIKIP